MKLLLDQNLSHKLCGCLSDVFPDSEQARLIGLDRAEDSVLWQHAIRNNLIWSRRTWIL
jgi:predicted nuclease of predicted toxin-antitoxin system